MQKSKNIQEVVTIQVTINRPAEFTDNDIKERLKVTGRDGVKIRGVELITAEEKVN